MASVIASTVVIANPQSRGGTTARRLPDLRRLLDTHVPGYVLESTSTPGHARALATEHARNGATLIVVAGGDGTVQDVVGGILDAGAGGVTDLGILPMGTGCDLARGLGVPRALEPAVALLATADRRWIDVGRFECKGSDGPTRGYFVNVASVGLSGWSVRQLQRRPSRGHSSYLFVAVAGIFAVRPTSVRVLVDGDVVHDGPLTLVAVGNGSSFGGGMPIAPDASIDDGQFDVVVAPGMGRLALIGTLSKLRRKRHLGHRGVHCVRGRRVEAVGPSTVWVEADGESVGTLPLVVEIVPRAIAVRGLSAAALNA